MDEDAHADLVPSTEEWVSLRWEVVRMVRRLGPRLWIKQCADLDDLVAAVMAELLVAFRANALSGPFARRAYAANAARNEWLDCWRSAKRAFVLAAGDLADLEGAERIGQGIRAVGLEVERSEIELRLPVALAALGLDPDGVRMFMIMDWGGGTLEGAQQQLGLDDAAAASTRRRILRLLSDSERQKRLYGMVVGDVPLSRSPHLPTSCNMKYLLRLPPLLVVRKPSNWQSRLKMRASGRATLAALSLSAFLLCALSAATFAAPGDNCALWVTPTEDGGWEPAGCYGQCNPGGCPAPVSVSGSGVVRWWCECNGIRSGQDSECDAVLIWDGNYPDDPWVGRCHQLACAKQCVDFPTFPDVPMSFLLCPCW